MAESEDLSVAEVQAELSRIEAEVDSGNHDLRVLGFWRLLAQVKRRPELVEAAADAAGRIDAEAFDAGVGLKLPVWFGNLILLIGVSVGAFLVVIARYAPTPFVAGVALVLAAVVWSVCLHCPAHWAVGRVFGIRFRCYFLGGPFPPRPGLKTDYSTYLRAKAEMRAVMHAAGALATKAAPFVALAFYPGSSAPAWAAWVVLVIGIVQIITDIFLSTKSSDWKRVKREMAVARLAVTPGS